MLLTNCSLAVPNVAETYIISEVICAFLRHQCLGSPAIAYQPYPTITELKHHKTVTPWKNSVNTGTEVKSPCFSLKDASEFNLTLLTSQRLASRHFCQSTHPSLSSRLLHTASSSSFASPSFSRTRSAISSSSTSCLSPSWHER